MPFLDALSGGELTQIRAGGFSAPAYLLLAPNTVVFRARINQASFDTSFAQITYDGVAVGAIADAKEGYTCYISADTDPRNATHVFRIRKAGTSTLVYINETSASLNDDDWIIVTKDVREWSKLPRKTSTDYFKDYDINYQLPRPIIYDLQTVRVVEIDGDGNADVAFSPLMLPVEFGAGITSWLWDIDGGAFQAGSSSSQNITARYTVAGHYMPRVTVTDDNGITNWFAVHVFIIPSDYDDSNIYTDFDALSIQADLEGGWTASATAKAGVSSILNQTFCCVYAPGNKTAINTHTLFCGRFRAEETPREHSAEFAWTLKVDFDMEGVAAVMGRMISRSIPMIYDASPTEWDELEGLTPWRAVAYFLAEHTTIPNTHSITFDATGTTWRFPNFTAGDNNILDSVTSILETINARMEYAPQGEIHIARQAVYLDDTGRDALTTIEDFAIQDVAIAGREGEGLVIERDYLNVVGIEEAWGGYFNTTSKDVQTLQARTPAVTQSDGNERGTLNRQVLTANSTLTAAGTELGERTGNDFAARQPTPTMEIEHQPEYRFLIPSGSQWYTWTIAATDNGRGVTYDTDDRWLLTSISMVYDFEQGFSSIGAVYQLETQKTDYQTIVTIPPTETPFVLPILPGVDDFPFLDELPNIDTPDGTGFGAGDEPVYDDQDIGEINNPQDPGTTQDNFESNGSGDFGIIWDASQIWTFSGVITSTNPTYTDVTPTDLEGFTTITDAKLAPQNNNSRAWMISNDGTNSRLWRTANIGGLQWGYTQIAGVYTHIRITSTTVSGSTWLYILDPGSGEDDPWEHTFKFDTATGPEERDITYDNDKGWEKAPGQNIGVFASGVGWNDETQGTGTVRLRGVSIRDNAVPATTITQVTVTYDLTKGAYEGAGYAAALEIGGGVLLDQVGYSSVDAGVDQTYIWSGLSDDPAGNFLRVSLFSDFQVTPFVFSGDCVVKQIKIEGTGNNPYVIGDQVKTMFSTNNGVSFHADSPRYAGATNAGNTGVDTQGAGGLIFAGVEDQIQNALDEGAYSAVTNGVVTGSSALCIRYHGINQSRFIFGSAAAVGGESLWRVRTSGQEAITPNDGSNDGIVVSVNSIDVAPQDHSRIFVLADFGGTPKLAISIDDGDNWTFQTGVTASANYIRAKQTGLLYIADGANIKVSLDVGTTLLTRTSPSAALLGIEVK